MPYVSARKAGRPRLHKVYRALSIRFPVEIADWCEQVALTENRSMCGQVVEIVEAYYRAQVDPSYKVRVEEETVAS